MEVGTAEVTPPGIVAEAHAEDIRQEVTVAAVRLVVEVPLGIPVGTDLTVAPIVEEVEEVSDAAGVGPGTRGPAL